MRSLTVRTVAVGAVVAAVAGMLAYRVIDVPGQIGVAIAGGVALTRTLRGSNVGQLGL